MNRIYYKLILLLGCGLLVFAGCKAKETIKNDDYINSPKNVTTEAETTKDDDYTNAKANVIMETEVAIGDTAVDLSSVEKVFDYADLVIVGEIQSIGVSQYRDDRVLPYSLTEVVCETVLKGEADGIVQFSFAGGYVPALKYFEQQTKTAKNSKKTFSDEEIQNGFVHMKYTKRLELEIGKKYVLFLSCEENGERTAVGSDYSFLSVDNNAYKDFSGKQYRESDLLMK